MGDVRTVFGGDEGRPEVPAVRPFGRAMEGHFQAPPVRFFTGVPIFRRKGWSDEIPLVSVWVMLSSRNIQRDWQATI